MSARTAFLLALALLALAPLWVLLFRRPARRDGTAVVSAGSDVGSQHGAATTIAAGCVARPLAYGLTKIRERRRMSAAHTHDHAHGGHSHGLVHDSIKRSREGLRHAAAQVLARSAHPEPGRRGDRRVWLADPGGCPSR